MKILFLSTLKGSPWGGSEELWAWACERALAAGHVPMVSRYEWETIPARLAELGRMGARVQYRPRRPGRIARLFPRPKWLREIEAFGPEVICISQGGAYECAGHRSMRPLLRWLKTGAGKSVPVVNVIQFNAEDAGVGRAAAEHARWLYQRTAMNCFVAQDNIRIAEKKLGVTIPRTKVVVNPVNLRDSSMIPWPVHNEHARPPAPSAHPANFACVARLDQRTKGQETMLRILGSPAWKQREWTLSFFGEGPDRERFERIIAETGIGDRVHFRGHTSDVRAIWAEHEVLLLPSRAEGTPLAMIEAMMLGRPCMVCAVGGCAQWVDDGVEGFIAPEHSPEQVGGALERLWSARDRWPEMGRAARERAIRQTGQDPGEVLLNLLLVAAARTRLGEPGHPR